MVHFHETTALHCTSGRYAQHPFSFFRTRSIPPFSTPELSWVLRDLGSGVYRSLKRVGLPTKPGRFLSPATANIPLCNPILGGFFRYTLSVLAWGEVTFTQVV
jgi:hypothetical protein